jgi:hypothetical protein
MRKLKLLLFNTFLVWPLIFLAIFMSSKRHDTFLLLTSISTLILAAYRLKNTKHSSNLFAYSTLAGFLLIILAFSNDKLISLPLDSHKSSLVNAASHNQAQQASTYRLTSASNSYAQYLPWYPCLNGTLIFEFKTTEPNGLLLYAQSLPYKYIQMSLIDGNLRLRMRIGEKDNPRGIFMVYQTKKLNDNDWHEIQLTRMNERTMLGVDGEFLYHVHKDANLEGQDLFFGDAYDLANGNGNNGNNGFTNSFFIGGLPLTIQTFDLSLGTALFEQRYSGLIRNVRALNCSSPFLSRLNVIASAGLKFETEKPDPCLSNPCLNNAACSLIDDDPDGRTFDCDCSYTNYEGDFCEKRKFSLIKRSFDAKTEFSKTKLNN